MGNKNGVKLEKKLKKDREIIGVLMLIFFQECAPKLYK